MSVAGWTLSTSASCVTLSMVGHFNPRSSVLRYVLLLTSEKSSWVRPFCLRMSRRTCPNAMLSSNFQAHKRNDEAFLSPIELQSIVFILEGLMFTTYRRSEIQLPDLGNPQCGGTQIWPYVEQELIYPWFYLNVVRVGATESDTCMLMIQHARDVVSLVRRETSRMRVEEVQIVTPAHVNGTDRWLMEPVKKISVLESPSLGGPCEAFEVDGGNCYSLSGSGVLENATLIQVIFDAATDLKNSR